MTPVDLRVVATDLDGTIVHADHSVSVRTVDAFQAAREAGVVVVLVTGRPPRWIWPLLDALGVHGPLEGLAVSANGAVVVDLGSRQIVHRHVIPTPLLLDVADRLRGALRTRFEGNPVFAVETGETFAREDGYHSRLLPVSGPPSGALSQMVEGTPGAVKLLTRLDGVPADDLLAVAQDVVGAEVCVTHSNPADSLLEIAPAGVTKATTLARLVSDLGFSRENVIAFGDMPNDIPMLQWAGRGYAMAGGHPAALASADEIAPPLADDGVAAVLERFLNTTR